MQLREGMRKPGVTGMTVRGILVYRIACAAAFMFAGAVLVVDLISGVTADRGAWIPLELGGAVLAFSLSARSLGSRVELVDGEVRLHSIWRTSRLDLREIERVSHGRFFGWDVLVLRLAGDRSARLPLLTQPGDPQRLREMEEILTRGLSNRPPSSPTTPP